MSTVALDQRIDACQRDIDGVTERIEALSKEVDSLRHEGELLEVRLLALREARELVGWQKDQVEEAHSTSHADTHSFLVENDQADAANIENVPRDSGDRMGDNVRAVLTIATDHYPSAVTNQEFARELEQRGSTLKRDNLRSVLWTYKNRGYLEKVGFGSHRVTPEGAKRIGLELNEQ